MQIGLSDSPRLRTKCISLTSNDCGGMLRCASSRVDIHIHLLIEKLHRQLRVTTRAILMQKTSEVCGLAAGLSTMHRIISVYLQPLNPNIGSEVLGHTTARKRELRFATAAVYVMFPSHHGDGISGEHKRHEAEAPRFARVPIFHHEGLFHRPELREVCLHAHSQV